MPTAPAKISTPALETGDKAPLFDVSFDSGHSKEALEKMLPGKHMVLYFYPKDDTPGCTVEAKDFRDHVKDFEKANAVIIGVSKDSVKSHDAFKKKFCLPFPLASDETGKMCEDYGVWVQKSMYGKTYMGIERSTFLIDKTGVIRNIWRKVKVDGHVMEVLNAAKAL
jgi:peroxiredoxin Q/BCP